MAISLIDFDGANSGSIHTLGTGQAGVVAVGTPAPLSSKETFVYRIDNLGSPSKLVADMFAPDTEWITVGFIARWNSLGTLSATPKFFQAHDALPHFYLKWDKDNGDVKLYNASNALQDTASDIISVDTWYRFEMKWKQSSAGQFQLRVNGDLAIDVASMNLKNSGTSNVTPVWTNGSNQAEIVNVYIGSYYVYTDDGTSIDTNTTFLGDYTVLGSFESGTQGATGDFSGEDTLGSSTTLAMCQDTPSDDTDSAKMVISSEGQRKTGVATDHATATIAGPRNNPDVDDLIKGAKWTWRHTGPNAQFGQSMKFFGRYGRQSNVNKNTPNVVETPAFGATMSTTKANLSIVEVASGSSGNVPDKTEWFQQGFRIDNQFTSQKTGECVDMWNQTLHKERRQVVVGGKTQRLPS